MKKYSILLSLLFLLSGSMAVNAQYMGAWSTAWNNPISASASVMIQGAINRKMLEQSIANQRARSKTAPAAANYPLVQFKPVANTGVAKQLADALGKDLQERAQLLKIFQEVQRSYEAEARKGGKSNNIAAALTFFIAASSMAYHQNGEPAESVTDALVEILEQEMSGSPDFKSMSDLEKQQMHDWLVVTGGFVLAGYLDAVKTNDQKQLGDYKQLADGFFKLVLGTGAEKFNLAAIGSPPAND
jgi:hypothetical protein